MAARKRRHQMANMAPNKKTERDNIRLAILLGLIALGILVAFIWTHVS